MTVDYCNYNQMMSQTVVAVAAVVSLLDLLVPYAAVDLENPFCCSSW